MLMARPKFSLRLLLGLVALIAIALGAGRWWLTRQPWWQAEQFRAEMLDHIGPEGHIEWAGSERLEDAWAVTARLSNPGDSLAERLNKTCRSLRCVNFAGFAPTKSAALERLSLLESLRFDECEISADLCAGIARRSPIKDLVFVQCRLPLDAMSPFQRTSIECLSFVNTPLTVEDLRRLQTIQIGHLDVSEIVLSSEHCDALLEVVKARPDLASVTISAAPKYISADDLARLTAQFRAFCAAGRQTILSERVWRHPSGPGIIAPIWRGGALPAGRPLVRPNAPSGEDTGEKE
jgi:hypothetical protein